MKCDYGCVLCDAASKKLPARGWQYLGIFLALAGWAGLIGQVLNSLSARGH